MFCFVLGGWVTICIYIYIIQEGFTSEKNIFKKCDGPTSLTAAYTIEEVFKLGLNEETI